MVPTNDFSWEGSSLPCAKCRIQDGRHRGIFGHRSIDHTFSTREGTSQTLPPEIFSRDPNTFIKAKKRLPPEIARFQLVDLPDLEPCNCEKCIVFSWFLVQMSTLNESSLVASVATLGISGCPMKTFLQYVYIFVFRHHFVFMLISRVAQSCRHGNQARIT